MKYTVVTIHIYDRRKGQLNLELDGIKTGAALNFIIVALQEENIIGSLRNSLITGCRQWNIAYTDPIEESHASIYYKLGGVIQESMFKQSNKNDVDNFIVVDEDFNNSFALRTLVNSIGISQYATLLLNDYSMYQNNKKFSYYVLRRTQNMDWSDHSFRAGKQCFEQKQFDKAITCFDSAIETDSFNTQAYYYRGQCKLCQQKYEDSVNDLKKANTLDEKDPNIIECLKAALEKLKESLITTKDDNSFYLGNSKSVKVTIKGREKGSYMIETTE